MRIRILLVAALVALVVPSAVSSARPLGHGHGHGHGRGGQGGRVVGTWNVQVTPQGQSAFPALLQFNKGGTVVETESDQPGVGLGSWTRIGPNRYAFTFQSFILSPTGDPAGRAVVRGQVTLSGDTLSGPFKFDVFDPTGKTLQSGSGTATATRFAVAPL